MLNIKKTLTKILDALKADYVVEQGTSNGWTYRKWNSGTAECWKIIAGSRSVNTSSSAYGGYRSNSINIGDFPFTFTSRPSGTATVTYGSQGAWVDNLGLSTTGGEVYLSAGASLSATDKEISVHIIGTWK